METVHLESFSEILKLFNFGKFLSLTIGVAILWASIKTIRSLGMKLGKKLPSRRLLILQIVTICTFGVYIVGSILIVYGILRPPKELLFALGGSAAVAIGLSLKDLVSSLVAGFILLFDRPFQVGDRVTFGNTYGEIQTIGLRAVRLVTLDDNLVTIPNSKFVTDAVASGNAGALDMMVCVNFYLSPESDLQKARSTLFEILVTSRYVYLKKPVSIVATEMLAAEMLVLELKAKAYVLDVKYEKAFQSDIVFRVEQAFKELHLQRPTQDIIKV